MWYSIKTHYVSSLQTPKKPLEQPETNVLKGELKITTEEGHVFYRKLHSTSSLTMTSNCSGFATSCMQQLSTIISLYLIPGYLVATSRQDSKNRPSASFMMFALCTAVTFFLLFKYAYSKAYCAIRSEQNFVITYQ